MSPTTGHIVIAGPGRSGTTFLVRVLHAAGLDIGHFGDQGYDQRIRAGLERPFQGDTLPRVVKDPWLWTYVDHVDPTRIARLVVPIRELHQVAFSRVRNETRDLPARFRNAETFGRVPGGAVYDLSVRAQEDMAARNLYVLLQWAVECSVPLALVDFHAMIRDPEAIVSAVHHELTADERDAVRRAWHIMKDAP